MKCLLIRIIFLHLFALQAFSSLEMRLKKKFKRTLLHPGYLHPQGKGVRNDNSLFFVCCYLWYVSCDTAVFCTQFNVFRNLKMHKLVKKPK